jgi:hypothetical protein
MEGTRSEKRRDFLNQHRKRCAQMTYQAFGKLGGAKYLRGGMCLVVENGQAMR